MNLNDIIAFRAFAILIEMAAEQRTITYGELGARIGRHHHFLGGVLNAVIQLCHRNGELPNLTALVVCTDTGRCGPGYLRMHPGHDEDADRAECWAQFGRARVTA